jgi:undecaprenyl-diphosphatase
MISTALHRARAGFSRLSLQPEVSRRSVAPTQNPWIILGVFVVLSGCTMVYADDILGVWMQTFPEPLLPAAHWITDLGRGIEILVITLAILIVALVIPTKNWKHSSATRMNAVTAGAGFVFASVAGGGLVALVLKYTIGRARPYLMDGTDYVPIQPFAFDPNFAAFPSGHSATAGAMAMSLALLFPRLRGPFIAMGVMICLSRQFVGVHWPSDTLMGWAVGVAFTLFVAHHFARRRIVFEYDKDRLLRPRDLKRLIHKTRTAFSRS